MFSFGLIADPQYAPAAARNGRCYAASLDKLRAAVAALNGEDLAFVVTLGDIIDRDWANFDRVLPIYERIAHAHHFVLGNHEFQVEAAFLDRVRRRLGRERGYYDFRHAGYRFVVLDGNEVSLFANRAGSPAHAAARRRLAALEKTGAINAQPWNGGLSAAQLAWLEGVLAAARANGEKAIVFCHYPVHPDNAHNLWDAQRLTALLARFPNVVAYFNGHNHAGNYGALAGQHFVTVAGMVETPEENAYAVVDVHADRLVVRGFGRQQSMTLAVAPARAGS